MSGPMGALAAAEQALAAADAFVQAERRVRSGGELGEAINVAEQIEAALAGMPDLRDKLSVQPSEAQARVTELEAMLNNPHNADWLEGVRIEAPHQRLRYPAEHDAGKTPFDWFWLIGYLGQKAAAAAVAGDQDKARHHTISTGAALLNWHWHLSGRPEPTLTPDLTPAGAEREGVLRAEIKRLREALAAEDEHLRASRTAAASLPRNYPTARAALDRAAQRRDAARAALSAPAVGSGTGGRVGGYALGPYSCSCQSCGANFDGDKRATCCRSCALASPGPGQEVKHG